MGDAAADVDFESAQSIAGAGRLGKLAQLEASQFGGD
jgi:hypothetical protein